MPVKACTERRNWTEVNWRGLVFDELTFGQAVMHYSRQAYREGGEGEIFSGPVMFGAQGPRRRWKI